MAPKKNKGKKDAKQPKLDDAKLAELRHQQQAQAKAELRRRLAEETKNSKINSLKILNQWRKIMRLAKTESLKKDIEILSQNHERDVDRKDAILQMLDRDLEEAEDQYQMALRTHLANIDNLVRVHDGRLYVLERTFQEEVKKTQNDFLKEKQVILTQFKREKKILTTVIDAIEQEEEERENEAKHAFEQLREDIRNHNLEDINMLRISLDAQIEDLEQQFEAAHLAYLQSTAQRTHDFKDLTLRDQSLSQQIEQRRRKIDNLQTTIQHWRSKIRQLNRETEERTRLLREEKNSIQQHYQMLKQRIQVYRGTQHQRLLQLSQSANSCKSALEEKLNIAKRILQLSELSRKMETTEEQILPFVPAEATGVRDNTILTPSDDPASAPPAPPAYQAAVYSAQKMCVRPSDRLSNFHRKLNKIILDNIAIGKEKERLEKENAQLEDLIAQYVAGTTVTEKTLAEDNPLFVINGRANLNHIPPVRQERPTVQDVTHIMNVSRLQAR